MKSKKFLLFVLIVATSCMKVPKMEEDLGDPVAKGVVEKTLADSWGSTSFDDVKIGDFFYNEKTIKLSTTEPRLVLRKGTTVTEFEDVTLEDNTPARYIHMLVESDEISNDQQSKLSTREVKLGYRRESTTALATQKVLQDLRSDFQSSSIQAKDVENEIQLTPYELFVGIFSLCHQQDITCFRLESSSVTEEAPEMVRQDPHCQGLPDCRWTLTQIQFVVQIKTKEPDQAGETTSKAVIKVKVSKVLPFLGRLVEYCYTGIATYQNQKFPVEICHRLKNFKMGTGQP